MSSDPVRGKTLHWSFTDGPMAGVTYEHVFRNDGTVTWAEPGKTPGTDSSATYEVDPISDGVYVVSYLSKAGYALTTVVDERSSKIVSFASNEKELSMQHGTVKESTPK
ncbi:MAG: MoaF N-terminal domain-containing protein [Chloroflexota bacterium]